MTAVTHPTPLQVRQWMQQRQAERKPVPTPSEIRMQLGWTLIVVARAAERGQDLTDEFR